MPFVVGVTIAVLLLLPGILLALVPGVLGIIYMLLVAIIFGVVDGFTHMTGVGIGILAGLTALTLLGEFLAGIIGAKWGGAHWSSIIWGVVGILIGSWIIPIPFVGGLVGMFLGVLVSELYRTNDMRHANKAATGSFLGWLAGTGYKVVMGVVFLVLFLVLILV